jgi:hypothetical protein
MTAPTTGHPPASADNNSQQPPQSDEIIMQQLQQQLNKMQTKWQLAPNAPRHSLPPLTFRAPHLNAPHLNDFDDPMMKIDIDGDGNGDLKVPMRTRALLDMIKKKADIYQHTAEYYTRKNMWINVPTIIITASSGLLSFVSSTDMLDAQGTQIMGLVVGLLATVATILTSFGQTMAWSTKAEVFRGAAQQYNLLTNRIEFAQFAQKPLIQPSADPNDHHTFTERIRQRDLEIQWQVAVMYD